MSDTATSLTDQYTAQITADIARVSEEREKVREEIAGLQQRLETLEADHRQLLQMQSALTSAPATVVEVSSGRPGGRKKSVKVPRPRASQAPARARAARPEVKVGRTEATWGEIVLSYLTGQQGPQSVAEITNGVIAAHPARKVQATVLRNTLEGLVARGRVQRAKQKGSVTYSMVAHEGAAEQAGPEQVPAGSSEPA
ncbi:hypothetical protein [Streptomyces roseifaciens]|uniref:hypothetical protein n=1 Tax=Streptomyces roseifaciens TaxID=1488406 RepID=UPI000717F501|nr:hypothetical protein [Streptomyces roseifaciens]